MEEAPFSSLEREPDLSPHVELIPAAMKCYNLAWSLAIDLEQLQAPDEIMEPLDEAIANAATALLHNSYPFAVHTPLMLAATNALDWKINHKGATTNA